MRQLSVLISLSISDLTQCFIVPICDYYLIFPFHSSFLQSLILVLSSLCSNSERERKVRNVPFNFAPFSHDYIHYGLQGFEPTTNPFVCMYSCNSCIVDNIMITYMMYSCNNYIISYQIFFAYFRILCDYLKYNKYLKYLKYSRTF